MIACLAVSDAYSLLQHFLWHYTLLYNILFYNFCVDRAAYDIARNLTIYIGRYNAGFHLSLLAIVRYMAVVHPLKFKTYCSSKKVILASLFTWIFVLLFSTLCTIVVINRHHIFKSKRQSYDFRASLSFLNFIIPTLLFITLHCLKMRALRRSPALNKNTSRKMTIVITIIILIYVASSASIALGQFEIEFFGKINTLAFITSCAVNPFIYFMSSTPMVRLCSTHSTISQRKYIARGINYWRTFVKAILQVLIYKALYDKSYLGSQTTMTSDEWTCLISFATAPLTCSEQGGSEKFKMKIYVSSGIRTHTPPIHDRKVVAP